jgi:hypothetical protein
LVGRGWEVIEGEQFELGALNCGGLQKVDEVIAAIKHALSREPHGFHRSRNHPDIWVARTKTVITGPDIVLSHRVLYRINEAERSVTLLWVEFTDPDADEDWDTEPF